ncbi:MAG: stage III sporulation protein AB [Clostridia bacterium]|nr:stage III sporulation protein AB [Clostridia bacterium]
MRLCGAVLLLLFFSLCGVYAGAREKKRLAQCEAFLELFEYIKNQVEFFLTPTKVMYRNFLNSVLENCGFLPALRSHESDEVYCDIWRISLAACEKNLLLTEKQRALVLDFGDCVGKSHGQIQSSSFDYYIMEMRAEAAREKETCAKNVKLYRTLGIAAGACAAILVI